MIFPFVIPFLAKNGFYLGKGYCRDRANLNSVVFQWVGLLSETLWRSALGKNGILKKSDGANGKKFRLLHTVRIGTLGISFHDCSDLVRMIR
ncbi:MAG: hypothetical protein A3B66_09760 [Alphaproteobacteria bacterium RIFCSPHIGHO2_02_FULL_46_13]|nr:MAG: hypothetical protein A3B66_09760 [Alphaproteobacteria bacterium RIFCSPHIGHO2_02_FULL_46_13]